LFRKKELFYHSACNEDSACNVSQLVWRSGVSDENGKANEVDLFKELDLFCKQLLVDKKRTASLMYMIHARKVWNKARRTFLS
jgi:hypothetical protein